MLDYVRKFARRLHTEFSSRLPRNKKSRAAKRQTLQQAYDSFTFPTIPDDLCDGAVRLTCEVTAHRDKRMPKLYEIPTAHPRRPAELVGLGRDFVYAWHSRDPEFIECFRRIAANEWGVELGPNATMRNKGLYEVGHGDMVWVRDLDACDPVPINDSLQSYSLHPEEFGEDYDRVVANLNRLRDESLGPKETRSKEKVAFEANARATRVKGARCYSVGLNTQKPRNLAGPAVGNKLFEGDSLDDDAHLKWRKEVLEELADVGVKAFKRRQPDEYEVLNDAAELFNTPRIGVHHNSIYTGGQLNLAVPRLKTCTTGLVEMKVFGEKHYDGYDSLSAHSFMTSNSDLPEGYEGGRFHLVELGMYVRLEGLVFVSFSGLRWHGGTPPLATDDVLREEDIPADAYRWVFILYPQGAVLDGRTSFNVAAQEDHSPFQLTASMRDISESIITQEMEQRILDGVTADPGSETREWFTQEVNFCADGPVMMKAPDLLDFTTRSLFLHANSTYRQLEGEVESDYDCYRRGFKLGGVHPRPWDLAPDGSPWTETPISTDLTLLSKRQQVRRAYQLLCASNARFIVTRHHLFAGIIDPTSSTEDTLMPTLVEEEGEEVVARQPKGRPKGKGPSRGPVNTALKRKRVNQAGVRELLLKQTRSTLVKHDASRSLMERSQRRWRQDHRAVPHVGEPAVADDLSPPNKRPRRKVTFRSWLDEAYSVRAVEGHKLDEGQWFFLCSWVDQSYDAEWIVGGKMDPGSMLNDYCSKHDIGYDEACGKEPVASGSCVPVHTCSTSCAAYDNGDEDLTDGQDMSDDHPNSDVDDPDPSASNPESGPDDDDDDYSPPVQSFARHDVVMEPSPLTTKMSWAFEQDVPMDDIDAVPDLLTARAVGSPIPDDNVNLDQGYVQGADWPLAENRFLRRLTASSVKNVKTVFDGANDNPKSNLETVSSCFDSLVHAKRMFTSHPFEPETALCASKSFPILNQLQQHINHLQADIIVVRWLVLRAHHEIAIWISYCLAHGSSVKGAWIGSLLLDVNSFLQSDYTTRHTFSSKTYLDVLGDHRFEVVRDGKTKVRASLRAQLASDTVLQILCSWLGVPAIDAQRAEFLCILGRQLPPSVFLLDEVWEAYGDVVMLLPVRKSRHRQPSALDLERLENELQRHPLKVDPSQLKQLDDLQECLLRYIGQPPIRGVTLDPIPTQANASSSSSAIDGRRAVYETYRDFLRDCLPLLDDPIPPSSVLPNWDKATDNLDHFLPFRESSPSRLAIVNCANSPLADTNIRTRGGIFSLLVYRGILYNTRALHDGARRGSSFMFDTLEEWQAFRAKPGPESYFCNAKAYGSATKRSSKHADAYWTASQNILDKIVAGIGFIDLVFYVSQAKRAGKSAIPAFGKLTSYLFVVDLVYAGAVAWPPIEEIADAVIWLDKGAVGQLRALGVPAADVRSEFIALYNYLLSDEGLSEGERARMGFDGFIEEHGLCKRGRFYISK